jgi:SnoaL-like polyketide cyclase
MTSASPQPTDKFDMSMSLNLGSYASVPDFIYGITKEIWEDRGIGGALRKYYAADILLRAATGFTNNNDSVTAQTLQTLHQFPNRQLIGEDVIWTGFEDGSFFSSHRSISVMTHTGNGVLGHAQGQNVRSRVIADCWVVNQVVMEEWLVRDQAAFANCLGLEPCQLARDLVDRELRSGAPISFFVPAQDRPGRFQPTLQSDATIDRVVTGLNRIWNDKETAVIRELYFHGAALHAPGGGVFYGHSDIDVFVLGYLASFPDAVFRVESARINRDSERPVRVALRWSLTGTHGGFGHFGEPTGAPIYVMGMSHLHITQGLITAEYLLTDEVAIFKQIFAHTEGRAGP